MCVWLSHQAAAAAMAVDVRTVQQWLLLSACWGWCWQPAEGVMCVLSGAAHGLLLLLLLMDACCLTACAGHGGSSAPIWEGAVADGHTHVHAHT